MIETIAGYVTKEHAAERLGKTVRRIEEMIQKGLLSSVRMDNPATNRKQTVVAAADVNRLRAQPISPAPGGATPTKRTVKALPAPEAPAAPVKPWITLKQAAESSGLTVFALRKLIVSGDLPAVWVGTHSAGGGWRLKQAALDAFDGIKAKPE